MIPIDLNNKVALVTGASQGLGYATARKLHAAGASVAINYFADPAGANAARAQALVQSLGQRAMMVQADVRNYDAATSMVEQVFAQWTRLDIVVNNAGIVRDRTIGKMTPEDWQAVIDTNLTGVFNVCRAAVQRLADGGRIVNLASVSAAMGTFGQGNYVAAKSGVIGLTKVLARELARRQITVNAVAPGLVLTDMGLTVPQDVRLQWLATIPLGRFGEPDDIADAILFLCSDLARYVTGQTLHVNGGSYW